MEIYQPIFTTFVLVEEKLIQILEKSKHNEKENAAFLKRLKKQSKQNIDQSFHQEHDAVFDRIDCLDCGNCCSTTSPIFTDQDTKRLSKLFRVKPVQFIAEYLRGKGIDVLVTREPGGTQLGEQVRNLLLTPRDEKMVDDAELLLMFAARVQHIQQKILPALNSGQWVVSDRFVDATFAYQGGGRQIGRDRIDALAKWSLQGLTTDLTFLFDLPVDVGLQRLGRRGNAKDRIELEKRSFFDKVRNCYLQIAEAEPDRVKIINATQSVDNIQLQLTDHLKQLLETA